MRVSAVKEKNKDYVVQVLNWNEYQSKPKPGQKMHWFKVESGIFFDTKFNQLSTSSKLLWFYLLSLCCKDSTDIVHVSYKLYTKLTGVRTKMIHTCVNQLEQFQLVRLIDAPKTSSQSRVEKKESRVEKSRGEEIASAAAPVAVPRSEPLVEKTVLEKKHWLVDMWNEFGARLPKAQNHVSSSRLKKIQARIKDHPNPEKWKEAIIRLAESDFANGMNDRSWVATFDFILQTEALEKILEGKYDNRRKMTKQDQTYMDQLKRIESGEL